MSDEPPDRKYEITDELAADLMKRARPNETLREVVERMLKQNLPEDALLLRRLAWQVVPPDRDGNTRLRNMLELGKRR